MNGDHKSRAGKIKPGRSPKTHAKSAAHLEKADSGGDKTPPSLFWRVLRILFVVAVILGVIILIFDRWNYIKYDVIKINPTDVEITDKNITLFVNNTNKIDVHLYNYWREEVTGDFSIFLANTNDYQITCYSVFPNSTNHNCNNQEYKHHEVSSSDTILTFNIIILNSSSVGNDTLCAKLSTYTPKYSKEKMDCAQVQIK